MKKNITIVLLTIISLFSFQQSYANIAEGRKDTFIWYITDEGQLVLAPDDGTYENLQQGEYNVYKEDIKSAKVEAGVTPTTCRDMFSDLYNMETIDISGLNTENVADMISMFQNCSSLKAIDLSTLNTQNVTNMVGMFSYCSSLTSLDVSSLNTQNVMRMNYMFGFCSALESINFGNFNTSSATDMRQLFASDNSLKELDLSGFNTQKVTNMSQMFYDCSSLTKLNLTGFNNANATDISRMFMKCPALKTIISNRETPSTLLVGTFTDSFDNRDSCNLVVPAGSEELYAAADGWNELGSINDVTEPVGPAIPADAIASGEVGTCIWYITSENELVIAPADGVSGDLPEEGWPNQYDDEWNIVWTTPWSEYHQDVLTVKIIPGVNAKSCECMFAGLNNLVSADLYGLNTQNVTSMSSMFEDCLYLTSLDLSNFNTENVTNMQNMFAFCARLTSLELSSFNTKNVKWVYNMFCGCSLLTSLDLSSFNTENMTGMGSMFSGCRSLTSLDLSNFNTENVTDMGTMFFSCSSLTSLDLSNFNTENVTEMDSMFSECSSLTSLDLSNFNTENVTDMGRMFNNCSSLTSLDLSNFNMQNVTNMSDMFTECFALNTITSNRKTPSTLKVGTFESFDNRADCTLLVPAGTKALYAAADGWNELGIIDDSLSNDGPEFPADAIAQGETGTCIWYITSENELVIAPADGVSGDLPEEGWDDQYNAEEESLTITTPWYAHKQDIFSIKVLPGVNAKSCRNMFADLHNAESADLSGLNTQNATDLSNIFFFCSNLTSLDLSSFNTQNVESMHSMFCYCDSLTSLNISNFNTANVTDMGNMFWGCGSLTSLDLSHFNTENVTKMYSMFYDCTSLTSINLSSFNTSKVMDMGDMFEGCSSLTSIDVSNFNTQNVTEMSWMFARCSALTSLDVSNFNTENVTSISDMFAECSSLTSLDVSHFNTQNVSDMVGMFAGCSSLTSLDVSNFDTRNVTEMRAMFAMCSSLTSLDISNLNTQNVEDMNYMFYGCTSLASLNLTNFSMERATEGEYGYIEEMFTDCPALTTIISNRATPSILKVGTFDSFDNRANCNLVVPAGSEELYAAADGWNELGSINAGTQQDDAYGTSPLYLTSAEPFYNSGDYTAEKVTYTRHFSKHTKLHTSDGWETIILPFNVQKIVTEDGRLLAPFGSTLAQADVALPFWLAEMKDGQFVFATSIRANTPYIICMPNGDDINPKNCISGNVVFSASNTTVYASDKAQSVQGPEGFTFVPTYNFVDASDYVYAINDEVYSDGAVDYQPGSVFARNSRAVRPFEAYMQHDASSAFAPRFIPVMPDEADGIVTITPDNDKMSIYDLSGRKIDTMRKGVNIVVKDGKVMKIKSPL